MKIEYLSPSQIELYNTCPMAYMYKYKEKIQTKPSVELSIGKAVHHYIEKKLKKENDMEPIDNFFKGFEGSEERVSESKEIVKNIINFIQNDSTWVPSDIEHIETERMFSVEGIPILLIPDVVTRTAVFDHKVISKRSIFRYEKKYPIQLILAGIAFKKDIGVYNLFIKDDKIIYTKREHNNMLIKSRRAIELVKHIYRCIKNDMFPPVDIDSDKGWKCSEKWCDFYSICRFGQEHRTQESDVYF